MSRHMSAMIAMTLSSMLPSVAAGQPSVVPPRGFARSQLEVLVNREGTWQSRVFDGTGGGIWPGDNARLTLDTKVYALQVLGAPKCNEPRANAPQDCSESIALELAVDMYVVDALGQSIADVREYLISKKGSPLAIRYRPSRFAFNTKRGDVRQSWFAGESYLSLRAIPLANTTSSLAVNGAAVVGYTFLANIDFNVDAVPGTAFLEVTPTASYAVGGRISDIVFENGARFAPGLDYRIGYSFGRQSDKSLSLTGTFAWADVRDAKNLLNVVFSRGLSAPAR